MVEYLQNRDFAVAHPIAYLVVPNNDSADLEIAITRQARAKTWMLRYAPRPHNNEPDGARCGIVIHNRQKIEQAPQVVGSCARPVQRRVQRFLAAARVARDRASELAHASISACGTIAPASLSLIHI